MFSHTALIRVCTLLALLTFPLRAFSLELTFEPASAEFQHAADEYQRIWTEEGPRIVDALQSRSGATLAEESIHVLVIEESSYSGDTQRPMQLRASYGTALKRGTLVHELGHRYLQAMRLKPSGLGVHQQLNLLVLPVWRSLWGTDFADAQIRVERRWSPDYSRAWQWALSLSEDEFSAAWDQLRQSSATPTGAQ